MRSASAMVARLWSGDFVRHGLLVFSASMIVNVLGYVFHFAISRRIGVEQYGVLSALNAAYMISSVIGAIGSIVIVKYAAEYRAGDDRAHLAGLVRNVTRYGVVAAALVTIAGVASAPFVAAYLKIGNVTAVALTMLVIGFNVVSPFLRGILVGTEDFARYAASIVLESGLKAICGIGLVYLGYGVDGAFIGWACGSCISFAYTAIILGRRYRRVPGAALVLDVTRLVNTTANVALATVLLTSISYADVLVVKHFADPTTAGLYGALALSGKMLFFFVSFVPTIVLPKATRQALGGTAPVEVFLQATALIGAMSAAGLAVYYVAPKLVVTSLAGASFAPAAPYVFEYGFAMVLLAGLNVIVMYKIGLHRFDFVAPLGVCAVGEIVGISLHHRSLSEVIAVLVAGNGLALVASAYRVTSPLEARVRAVVASDAA